MNQKFSSELRKKSRQPLNDAESQLTTEYARLKHEREGALKKIKTE
jgi:hypothetical protein